MAFRNYRPVNMTAVRRFGVEYTNDTSQSIEVNIGILHNEAGEAYSELRISGELIDRQGGHVTSGTLYYRYSLSGTVPPGAKYIVTSSFIKEFWTENRPL